MNILNYKLYYFLGVGGIGMSALARFFNHYKKLGYEDFKLFFSGGEPTYWEPLIEIMDFAKAQLPRVKFAVNTNLSCELAWWEKNHYYFDNVICSFHIEGAKQNRYLENYAFLQDKVNYLVARMMMHDQRFDEVLEFRNLFKNKIQNYQIEYVPLFRELSNKTEEWHYEDPKKREFFELNSFEKSEYVPTAPKSDSTTSTDEVYADGTRRSLNSNRLVAERKNLFAGWKCWIHESIFITAGGEVSFATCGQLPAVGNIFRDRPKLISEPIICEKKQCHCGTDICISKEKRTK